MAVDDSRCLTLCLREDYVHKVLGNRDHRDLLEIVVRHDYGSCWPAARARTRGFRCACVKPKRVVFREGTIRSQFLVWLAMSTHSTERKRKLDLEGSDSKSKSRYCHIDSMSRAML